MSPMMTTAVSNETKAQVWKNYRDRKPTRVPVVLGTNPRVVLQNPAWNPDGITFQQAAEDPRIHIQVSLRHQLHRRTMLHKYTDDPVGLPEVWDVGLDVYNVYEAAILGAPLDYLPGQVPDTRSWLNDDNKEEVFKIDIEHPLDNPFIKDRLAFWRELEAVCKDMKFEGRPVRLNPWALCGTDGPVTVAMNLRGSAFMEDLVMDEDYADRLMRFIIRAAIIRRRAFESFWGDRIGRGNGMADDSVAMLGADMYRERVLPVHRMFYDAGPAGSVRGMHLCGDSTRHFPTIHEQLGVTSFDTGFPVDFGRVRDQLGEDVEIAGGPEVALLLSGTPDQVYERAKSILQSGIKRGGRFILREGNNLPPNVPEENLAAMYQASLDFGEYTD